MSLSSYDYKTVVMLLVRRANTWHMPFPKKLKKSLNTLEHWSVLTHKSLWDQLINQLEHLITHFSNLSLIHLELLQETMFVIWAEFLHMVYIQKTKCLFAVQKMSH